MRRGFELGVLSGTWIWLSTLERWPAFAHTTAEYLLLVLATALLGYVLGAGASGLRRLRASRAPRDGSPAKELPVAMILGLGSGLLAGLGRAPCWPWTLVVATGIGGALAGALAAKLLSSTPRLATATALLLLSSLLVVDEPAAQAGNDRGRILVFGLDAGSWRILNDEFERGRLPHLKSLVNEGSSGPLLSQHPILSPRVWTTIATGQDPAQHGVMDFFSTQNQNLRSARFWEVLARHGWSIGLFQWLVTWPPDPYDPFVVPAWMARDPATHPDELAFLKELEQAFQWGKHKRIPDLWRWTMGHLQQGVRLSTCIRILGIAARDLLFPEGPEVAYAAERRIQLMLNGDLFLHWYRSTRPDFSAFVCYGTDNLAHQFWKYTYPQDFGIDAGGLGRRAELLLSYYQDADELLGKLLARCDQDTTVLVISDHGFESSPRPGRIDEYRELRPRMTALCERTGLQSPAEVTASMVSTKGFAQFPGPLDQAAVHLQQARDQWSAVRVARTGAPLLQVTQSDLTGLEVTVDADAASDPEERLETPWGELLLRHLVEVQERSGNHGLEGILLARGPHVKKGHTITARIHDIAPTILWLAGLPVAQDMQGRVLSAMFEDSEAARPILTVPTYQDCIPPRDATHAGDSTDLRKALQGIGYLDR